MDRESSGGGWMRVTGALSLALFAAGPALANFGVASPLAGFGLFVLGGLLGIIASLAGIVRSFRRGLNQGRTAVALGILPAAILIWSAAGGRDFPRINDISTDLDDPPAFIQAKVAPPNKSRDMSYPEAFRPIVRESYPALGPLKVAESPKRVFDRALLIARGTAGWTVTLVANDAMTFEGIATSSLFHFKDDFIVRVRPDGAGARVDMRSKSRDGQGDLGANAKRIRQFFAKLRATT